MIDPSSWSVGILSQSFKEGKGRDPLAFTRFVTLIQRQVGFLRLEGNVDWLSKQVSKVRKRRGAHVFVIVLRYLLGFAFLPAGLKKLLGQPFTDPEKMGAFHEFLHAFHDTGVFYHFVGGVQLLAACLLLTQRFALIGTLMLAPILAAILVFCWSTQVIPTAIVVTMMSGGTLLLLLWDMERFRVVFSTSHETVEVSIPGPHPSLTPSVWERCGWLILLLYVGNTVVTGEVYRPMGAEWHDPSFWVLNIIAMSPFGAAWFDRRLGKRRAQ